MDDILMDDLYTNKPKTTLVNSNENLVDGDIDSAISDLTRSNEDLKFIDAFDAIAKKNSEDKIRMMKKIKTNYKLSKESLSYSIESYCDTEIQSLEGTGEKIKDNVVAVFKKIAEFIRHLFDVITNMRYRGKTVDGIKAGLKIAHDATMEMIKLTSNKSDFSNEVREKIKLKQDILELLRRNCLDTLKCLNLAYKYAKKSGKTEYTKNMGEFIDSDLLEKAIPELKGMNSIRSTAFYNNSLKNFMSSSNIKFTFTEDSINATDKKEYEKTLTIYSDNNKALKACQEKLQKKLDELTNKK